MRLNSVYSTETPLKTGTSVSVRARNVISGKEITKQSTKTAFYLRFKR